MWWREGDPEVSTALALETAAAWAFARLCLEWWQRPLWRWLLVAPPGIDVKIADLDVGEFDGPAEPGDGTA